MTDHVPSVHHVVPMDCASDVYWTCSCGAAGDEDWPSVAAALAHYRAAHID